MNCDFKYNNTKENVEMIVPKNVIKSPVKWQRILLIALAGVLGVALIVFSSLGEDKKDAESEVQTDPYADANAYADDVEKRVAELCGGVKGAGEVSVLVSLKGGYKTVYAVDAQSNSTGYKSEVVMSGSGSAQKPLVAAYENPEIAGVGIVCTGGDDPAVRKEIIELVSAALNISTNKIFVASCE